MKSNIPKWVPVFARQKILALREEPGLGDADRARLERLAAYPAMKTDVWRKLPSKLPDMEGVIIEATFRAVQLFSALPITRPSSTAKKSIWKKYADDLIACPPTFTPTSAHDRACLLVEAMYLLEADIAYYWPSFWQGSKDVSRDQVVSIIEQLPDFFARMDNEYQKNLKEFSGGKCRNKKNSLQQFLTLHLSKCLQKIYGKPLDAVVAALVEVTLDISDGLNAETVRGRRRPVKNRKK